MAHDLGYRFEIHFPRVLGVILAATTAHSEVDVLEWSFSALAWLFKYLSRLIVPDIRPTYDIIAPYLGKAHHRTHIAKFAAEALSFLVRKAATRRDGSSLPHFIRHVFRDASIVSQNDESETYRYGLMTLFANDAKPATIILFRNDRILDTLHIAATIHAVYFYSISNFGNKVALLSPTW